MRLQKATRFGLYAVLELAAAPERQLSTADIAEKYGISINHLAKVMRDLGRAGLVESVRGAGGGFRFSGNARRTTLMDVIRLFETMDGPPVVGREPGGHTPAGLALRQVMGEIDETTWATLQSITISTMLKLIARRTRNAAAATAERHAAPAGTASE